MSTVVLWFRRDLRVHDHPALDHALATADRVAPLFVLDDVLLRRHSAAANRLWFMVSSVAALAAALAERGAPLTVLAGRPDEVVPPFALATGASRIVATRELTPYGRARDRRVGQAADGAGLRFEAGRGLLVHEPEEIRTGSGGAYTVFSPFHRAWEARPRRAVLPAPERIPGVARPDPVDLPALLRQLGSPVPTARPDLLPAPGEDAARSRLAAWAGSDELADYAAGRDRLDLDGTSRLSQDLRWGLLSPVEVVARCQGPGAGHDRFRSELAWRDFYAHLLWADPRIAHESQRRDLAGLAWAHDPAALAAWRDGRTGYPVVDAAMRQLRVSGWMHNRARMIVASFLTKHLGLDWRAGAEHFMAHLVDGDVASNAGGWQWAASTGTDAQPYFRVFNPTLQGRRHDPDGDYVRRWLPELRHIPGPAVHDPSPSARGAAGYPLPIVEHAEARARALDRYASARRSNR